MRPERDDTETRGPRGFGKGDVCYRIELLGVISPCEFAIASPSSAAPRRLRAYASTTEMFLQFSIVLSLLVVGLLQNTPGPGA